MSLTADIITYLTSQGHIDETNWRSNVGIQEMPARVSAAKQVIAIEDISTVIDIEDHGDSHRFEGFRLLVRGPQHDLETTKTKFRAVWDALQDQAAAINADTGTTETFEVIRSDNGGPLVSYGGSGGKADRPHLTATFRVVLKRS